MAKISLVHKRLSPNESVALVQDTENKKKTWRHRYSSRPGKSAPIQITDDYKLSKFKNINEFMEFVESLSIKGKINID